MQEHRSEVKRGRRARSDRKHPEKGIYLPPHLRNREATQRSDLYDPAPAYKLEIEVAPKQWHRQNIEKVLIKYAQSRIQWNPLLQTPFLWS